MFYNSSFYTAIKIYNHLPIELKTSKASQFKAKLKTWLISKAYYKLKEYFDANFAKEKVFWTKSMNISLAKFMEDKPHIWDPKHYQYSNIGLRDETFANFAAKYNDEFSWQAVKDRWTNIRSTYGFYMRKLNARKAKGENFKVNWFMWQPCKYLYKVHKFVDKKPGSTSKANQNNNSVASNPQDLSSDEANHDNMEEDTNVSCEDIVGNIVTVFQGVQNDVFGVDKTKYAEVGQAVTKKLSELNSYDAAQLSQKILEILAEYDENNPMNPNNL